MRLRTVTRGVLSLIASLSVHAPNAAAEPTKLSPVGKPRVQQSSHGCASPNITDNSGHIQIGVTCQNITILGQRNRMSSLEINQERLLLAQNPTEVRVTGAYLQSWLPDSDRISLTLEFENPRNIPIPEIEIDFLDPKSGPSIPMLKPIAFTPSQVYREVGSHKFSLAAGGKTALPVAFLDEIAARHSSDPDMCAFDAALSLEPPALDSQARMRPSSGAKQTRYLPLLLRVRFKSIFEQRQSSTRWVWIVYGRGSEGMLFWYPSKKSWNSLVCAL
ncbi:hypothetical protein [Paucibacter sp. M5-1]|uniref:hypothetical protein n=1 Tax=Paucibacter sp. M5-1 TaxID=3015998 RepID=UPI0022B88DAA|nr:hypothetical protein [Paucibacter sp. M5-1]MCZ7881898.1 hypothetical protein [Paucibacter sp. M5-1]